jgi:hypothetical protein
MRLHACFAVESDTLITVLTVCTALLNSLEKTALQRSWHVTSWKQSELYYGSVLLPTTTACLCTAEPQRACGSNAASVTQHYIKVCAALL